MIPVAAVLPTGMLLPEAILHSDSVQVLATFVALNSMIYASLAVLKMLPMGYALTRSRRRGRRLQNRSIYPEPVAHEPFASGQHVGGAAARLHDVISEATPESAHSRAQTGRASGANKGDGGVVDTSFDSNAGHLAIASRVQWVPEW